MHLRAAFVEMVSENVASSLNMCSIQAVERKHKVNTSMQTFQALS